VIKKGEGRRGESNQGFHLPCASISPLAFLFYTGNEMKKEERIARYGEAAYEKRLEQGRERYKANKEKENARSKKYREEHPEKVPPNNHEGSRKDGKYYDKQLVYQHTGIQ
jgi:hypothetical protein